VTLPDSARASSESWARTPPARLVRGGVQRFALVPILKVISPFTVVGKRNLAQLKGPAVFVANHQSHFDAPVCLAALGGRVRRRLVIAAAADYFYSTKLKGAAALTGNTCQGCRVALAGVELANLRKLPADEVKRCENCRRILVIE